MNTDHTDFLTIINQPLGATARKFTLIKRFGDMLPERGKAMSADEIIAALRTAIGKTLPLYLQEFADFDYELPVIPGWVDHSWHNDVSPHIEGDGLSLWCDYTEASMRETEGGKRFTLYKLLNDEGEMGDMVAESDDLAEIMAAIAAHRTPR